MGQVFFTLSIGFGALLAFASRIRNQIKNDCIRDAYIVAIVNLLTSGLAVCLVSVFGLGGLNVYKVIEYTFPSLLFSTIKFFLLANHKANNIPRN